MTYDGEALRENTGELQSLVFFKKRMSRSVNFFLLFHMLIEIFVRSRFLQIIIRDYFQKVMSHRYNQISNVIQQETAHCTKDLRTVHL